MRLRGWAFVLPFDQETTARMEFVQTTTQWAHTVPLPWCSRTDVSTFFGDNRLRNCGFQSDISFQGFPPGVYRANLLLCREEVPVAAVPGLFELELTLHPFELSARSGLAARFLRGSGIEIGALQRRLPLPAGCRVKYIDRMPLEQLIAHYPELGSLPLQAPDFVDDGERLFGIADGSQDFVVANHFFEHSQDPIRTLLNFARVLCPGGVLFMAVPDKRYTKDVLRPETNFSDLLDAFRTGTRKDMDRMYREWAEHWEHAQGEAITVKAKALRASDYSIHFNVWSLAGLLEFLIGARSEANVPFEITAVVSSENEVILILTRT